MDTLTSFIASFFPSKYLQFAHQFLVINFCSSLLKTQISLVKKIAYHFVKDKMFSKIKFFLVDYICRSRQAGTGQAKGKRQL